MGMTKSERLKRIAGILEEGITAGSFPADAQRVANYGVDELDRYQKQLIKGKR